ncbi:MAG TPA: FG-GAP-like repeat-containing protein [Cyclobacteriaceae bacterium]|nr:FG-GAP-like repeat-containing protein [Cyclobacteriaceae bacterium]
MKKVIAERQLLFFINVYMKGNMRVKNFVAIIVFVAAISCSRDDSKTLFSKLPSSRTGVTFNNVNVENESYNVFVYEYFYNGGGVALGDIDNDGLTDIYFSANQGPNKLYLNKGNFKFEDITDKSGTSANWGWKTGVAMVDINGDGFLDIYVCRSAANETHQRKNSLFINNGDLTFFDQAQKYGVDSDSYSTQASFLDYDRDGDLDMFLLNHAVSRIVRNFDIRTESKTERIPYVGNQLFENREGKFVDVSDSLGVYGPAHNFGLGVCYSDLNNDGWLDFYTSNDYTGSDKLLMNQQGKFFKESQTNLLTHISRFSMGTDIADVNNDGLTDIYSLDMLPDNNKRQKELMWADNYDIYNEMVRNGLHHQFMRNMLHLNNGKGYFSEIGQLAGVSNTDWSWSALFADYDNDGMQDLFVSNGYKRDYTNNDFAKYRANQLVARNAGQKSDNYMTMLEKMKSTKIHNYLFKNENGLMFSNVSEEWGMGELNLSNGAAYGDLDNDGDLDLVINNMDEKAGIYRNNSNALNQNRYLKVHLKGQGKNTLGIGSKVTAYANGNLMMRELCPYRGFQSSVEPTLSFGVGDETMLDSLVVEWPTGRRQRLTNVHTNQTLVVREDVNISLPPANAGSAGEMFREESSVAFTHHENNFIDFKYQPLLTRMYSTQGPAVATGDINGDGLPDFYFGGAKDQEGEIHIQDTNGKFRKKVVAAFLDGKGSEDIDAIFFDADNDNDLDLYVVTGGYEFMGNDALLEDKFYINDGIGNFTQRQLPSMRSSGSCVEPSDFDQDGDIDLFIGGRIIPGRYPEAPESFLLENNGNGEFSIVTQKVCPQLTSIGMVTDAAWVDLNNDKHDDLIVAGEWMPIKIFTSQGGKLVENTNEYFRVLTNGLWNTVLVHDFDHDGDADFIAGNNGLNNQIKPTEARPATLYYNDFDANDSVDPLLCYFVQDKSYPFPTRDELTEQLPAFKKKFPKYADYVTAGLEDILSVEAIENSSKLNAYHFETTYFRNDDGVFTPVKLPIELQFAPAFAFAVMDINNDGKDDLITGGNLTGTRARTGLLKGNNGFVFLGDNRGNFQFVKPYRAGISLSDDVRKIVTIGDRVFFAINDGRVKSFTVNPTDGRSTPEPSIVLVKGGE